MNTFRERLLRWMLPPATGRTLGGTQLGRGLAAMNSVGCPHRGGAGCRDGHGLFSCADCDVAITMPPRMRAAPKKGWR